ncbi:MAG: T9SS type A sorting domain-containing protein [Flavobacteriaceae bacterium]|nr:T9SS type A sorting domain-containing protein [Flavobacteriaceae bacterium]
MKYLYTFLLALSFLVSKAQVEPLLEPEYWTIEKVVIDNDTTYADTNDNDEYEKLIIQETSSDLGYLEFIIFHANLDYDNVNQSFDMVDVLVSFEDVPEGITEAGLLLINAFFVDEEDYAKNPFTYDFREEEDKIYLDITNGEGDVATFWTSTLSTPSFEEIAFSFYPNPVKDRLHLESPHEEIQNIEIFDMNGKRVLQSNFSIQTYVEVGHLARGVYMLKVDTKKGSATKKLVKE